MSDTDAQVRLAAFRFLEERVRLAPESGALPHKILERGFDYEGQRVPLTFATKVSCVSCRSTAAIVR